MIFWLLIIIVVLLLCSGSSTTYYIGPIEPNYHAHYEPEQEWEFYE